jgi:cytoskeleton protein RodZ
MARREPHGKLKLSLSPDETPARGVGATLRDARLRRGWTIEDCSQTLRIRVPVLEAMEAGRFERLPNGAYALGFVRTYADFLGLDRDEIVRRVKAEAAALSTKTELVFPTPISEGRLPSGVILLASAVLAAGAYGIWYYHTAADRVPIPRVAAVPEQVAAAPAVPAPAATKAPAEAAAATPRQTTPVVSSAPQPETVPPVTSQTERAPSQPTAAAEEPAVAPRVVAVPAPAQPTSSSGAAAAPSFMPTVEISPRQYGETADGRIVIKATGDSWVQVRDPVGNVVFSRILRAGESYNAPAQSGYLLATGSAGMLDIVVDGKKAPPIGRPGFVRKDVPLDPERLLAGTAVPPEAVRPAPAGPPTTAAPVAPAATSPAPVPAENEPPAGG